MTLNLARTFLVSVNSRATRSPMRASYGIQSHNRFPSFDPLAVIAIDMDQQFCSTRILEYSGTSTILALCLYKLMFSFRCTTIFENQSQKTFMSSVVGVVQHIFKLHQHCNEISTVMIIYVY